MVVRQKKKGSRNLLGYFMDSKVWKGYESAVTYNYAYWTAEDPNRARRMFAASSNKSTGVSVQEYISDMISCVYASKLGKYTKQRLYDELDALENYHTEMDSLDMEIAYG